MARVDLRLLDNVEGEFYVDSTCINCDNCRELAPSVFHEHGGSSVVYNQPDTGIEKQQAFQALLACPTHSIGTSQKDEGKQYLSDFPLHIEGDVYYLGFNSPKSYGCKSYFIEHPEGNWMIDSPKYHKHLLSEIEKRGGLKYIFLTHRDDVADAKKYSQFFNASRIIHEKELHSQPDSEIVVSSEFESFPGIHSDFSIVFTPGHTEGHIALLYKNNYLFSGDHIYWRSDWQKLRSSRRSCWWNWNEQIKSVKKLQEYDFSWILPGHGHRIQLEKNKMKKELSEFVTSIEDPSYW